MLETKFTYSLNDLNIEEIDLFFKKVEYSHILQNPQWVYINYKDKKVCFFQLLENDSIIAVAAIIERYGFANITFGPSGINNDAIIDAIKYIHSYYYKKRFAQLRIILPLKVSSDTEYIEYLIFKQIPFIQNISELNWSSIEIDINRDIDLIFRTFSENHRRSIKKAQKELFSIRKLEIISEVEQFSNIYDQMCTERGINKPIKNTSSIFLEIFNFFEKTGFGNMYGSWDAAGRLQAAIMLLFNGSTAFYQYGASIQTNKIPIMHQLFFETITDLKKNGLQKLDLGGFNHLVSDESQIFKINQFKQGFKGNYVFHPKPMIFNLNRFKNFVLSNLKTSMKIFGKKHKIFFMILNSF